MWRCTCFESQHFRVTFLIWSKEVSFQLFQDSTVFATVGGRGVWRAEPDENRGL